MADDNLVKILNNLIQTSEDGKKGFSEAREKATDGQLKTLFEERARQCDLAAQELQQAVERLGHKAEQGGSIAGAAHRGWVAVKAAMGDNNITVLEEVERGEDYAKAAYGKALKAELPLAVRGIVENQYRGVIRNHDRIRDLRNQYRAAA